MLRQYALRIIMPTRTDITSLAERLTHIEMRLDDLEARLDEHSLSRSEQRCHSSCIGCP